VITQKSNQENGSILLLKNHVLVRISIV